MFDIFGFLRHKQPQQSAAPEKSGPEPIIEKQVKLDNIAIYTMPEHFRIQAFKTNSAKTTGLIIIGSGAVFLILASVLLYFYLFKEPKVTVKLEQPGGKTEITQPIDQNIANTATSTVATTTEPATLPITDNASATSTATSTQEAIEQNIDVGLKPGFDSDNDGLTDTEEIILDTSTSTPDTDGDGYLDGAELLNLYDPAGQGKISVNSHIALYENKAFNYSLLYPSAWQKSVNGGDDSVMFKSADNQFIQIIAQPNVNKQSLDQWYMEQLGVTTINDFDRVSGTGWRGIKNLDGLTLYFTDAKQNYIFTLTYNPGGSDILEYSNIFKMMIKSFILKE